MSLLAATILGSLVALAPAGADDEAMFSSSDSKGLVKSIQKYYGYLDDGDEGKAFKEIEDIQDKIDSIAKKAKLEDSTQLLSSIGEWREIVRQGSLSAKPERISATARFGSKPMTFPSPLPYDKGNKDLTKVYDGEVKVFVSVPRDAKKTLMPVIVGLHPQEDENGPLKEIKEGKDLVDEIQEWCEETYPEEIREKAIIIVPVMDLVIPDANGLQGTRPMWDSAGNEGAMWVYNSLREIVLQNLGHDPTRIFLDGHGSASKAVVQFCAQFPGVQTGAIARGATPDRILFHNCKHSPLHFVGADSKAFFETWSQEDGFKLSHSDSLDPAGLAQWVQDNPKEYCPQKVELMAENLAFATAYWMRVVSLDYTLETKEPAHIIGEIDPATNTITVTTNKKVKSFIVYLNDSMLDLDKEIKIVHQGPPEEEGGDPVTKVRYEGTKRRLLTDTLELAYYRQHGNLGEVFTSQIRVDL